MDSNPINLDSVSSDKIAKPGNQNPCSFTFDFYNDEFSLYMVSEPQKTSWMKYNRF